MNLELEYGIKKDIRNNPVVREIDLQQKREFRRMLVLAALVVGMLLFSAWQHYEVVRGGYRIEELRARQAAEARTRIASQSRRAYASLARVLALHGEAPYPSKWTNSAN